MEGGIPRVAASVCLDLKGESRVNPDRGQKFADESEAMRHALTLAERGLGWVEPNPMVGAVVVDDDLRLIAEGFHQKFGEAHAEVNAISAAGGQTAGRQLFVTLEPCSHHGKTPPCAEAVIAAGFRRVVIGCQDPASHVAGQGIRKLRDAGLDVQVGVCEAEARQLIAPFTTLMTTGRPWIHAKWAMTLDGRIATRTGHSKWITNRQSRAEVHRLRGRVDAIITGAGTVRADDPQLTVRPPGLRVPLRVVLDSTGTAVQADSQLMRTLQSAPLLLAVPSAVAQSSHVQRLQQAGVEIVALQSESAVERVGELAVELGTRRCTNALLECGGRLMGQFFDADLVDEVHVFIAPKIVGGQEALSPVGGLGLEQVNVLESLAAADVQRFGNDVLIRGRIRREGVS